MSSNTDRVSEVDKSLVEPLLPGVPTGTIESASDAELESLIAARRGPLARFIARCRRAQDPTCKSRFKKILLLSLIVLFIIIIVVVVVVVVVVTKAKRRRVSWRPIPQPQEFCHQRAVWTTLDEYPAPGPAPRLRYVATTSFNFSRFDDSLYFTDGSLNSFGSNVHGAISFMTDADVPEDKINVDIIASYESREQFYRLGVCTVQRSFTKRGVGIFAPWWDTGNKRAYFQINVRFPLPKEGSNNPLFFNDVESRLPSFIHRVGDLQHAAQFHSFDISTVSTPIIVESLAANRISLRTSNANIRGYFNVTDDLSLNTSDGDITISGAMESDGLSECRTTIHSGGLLEANFTLYSTNVDHDRGIFSISTSTFNGPTDVVVSSAPIDHNLRFSANSCEGPLRIALPTTYEGPFSLISSGSSPVLKYDPNPVDPTGRGRNRTVEYYKRGPQPGDGRVLWGSRERNRYSRGNVYASNTKGPLTLELF